MRQYGRALSWTFVLNAVAAMFLSGCSPKSDAPEPVAPAPVPSVIESEPLPPVTEVPPPRDSAENTEGSGEAAPPPATEEGETDPALNVLSTPGDTAAPAAKVFGLDNVRQLARDLAAQPYQAPAALPKPAAQLNYDQYRRIQNRPDAAIWPDAENGYRVLLDPRGYLFAHDVRIHVVQDGQVVDRDYAAADFAFLDLPLPDEVKDTLGYAGFRLLAPLNQSGKYDEVISFKGASFFRALGAGAVYGASARGLSLGTATPDGEEFPYFTEFWIARPAEAGGPVRVYALLNGDSVTGAFEFTVQPGPETVVDVSATFFPRRELKAVGIAPITSMYFFSPHDMRKQLNDFRPAVHDSQGLMIEMQNGEWVWRPLINPQALQVSILATSTPKAFGLLQRDRTFDSYADVEADYQHRPNVWVQPTSAWGDGQLTLIEIPTANEYNDNIVTFWKPAVPWQKGESYSVSYRMRWSLLPPAVGSVIPIAKTLAGKRPDNGREIFVIDYESSDDALLNNVEPEITTSAGKIYNPTLRRHPDTGKTRLTFELDAEGASVAELRALLTKGGKPLTETWLYRWTS